jgi:orotidine-5'-phosphate decarboxylase
MQHFADRLAAAARTKGTSLCVGLDPRWEYLPDEVRTRHGGDSLDMVAAAYEEFCGRVLDVVAPLVPAVKPQSAFFEACGPAGFVAQGRLLAKARELGLIVVLDAKRNDIASTATAYAEAAFTGLDNGRRRLPVWEVDALTVNPYLGRDAVEPFLESARKVAAGVFVLVRTSNKGAKLFQDLLVQGDPPRPVYEYVGAAVAGWTRENLGQCGFGDVGAVVGATYPAEIAALRRLMPEVIFLMPGYGSQGGTAGDVAPAFRADGLGAVPSSSRGILFPFKPSDANWEAKIEAIVRKSIAELARYDCPAVRAGTIS